MRLVETLVFGTPKAKPDRKKAMSTTTITVQTPAPRSIPRGATLVGAIYDAVVSYRRYRAEANRLRQRAVDADSVRRFAARIQNTDPGMAADLRAAADRHVGAH
jgi:hypothetical protein